MSSREDFISGNGKIVQFLKGGREEGLGRLLATFRNSESSGMVRKLLPASSAACGPCLCAFLEEAWKPWEASHCWFTTGKPFPPLAPVTQ